MPKTPITKTTWLAVFDGGRAAVFENVGLDDAPNLRFVFSADHDNPPTREQGTDRPGRYPSPTGGGRSAVENTDLHDQAERKFVADLAGQLDEAAAQGRFDRLVVVAPAKPLAQLREQVKRAGDRIVGERAGDFVHAPIETIEKAFREALIGRR